ncbi:hypothetical protein [Streptomyces sp. t39]|uniref:hypothetical protein n=1 Tax=Streptomyces sp. t39 TaxID=1828156 RepID=UPI0011CD58A1|nr:hypothetical protein [Streptomyces sp. t39]TXS52030.1 hypothetical protein EAO77_21940 [Streptomyces sp. t39]
MSAARLRFREHPRTRIAVDAPCSATRSSRAGLPAPVETDTVHRDVHAAYRLEGWIGDPAPPPAEETGGGAAG